MARILVALTNESVAGRLSEQLTRGGHEVIIRKEGVAKRIDSLAPDAAILDASLKWTVCRPIFEALKRLDCPVLFITGDRKMTAHLRALYQGASDVIVAPYTQRGLTLKLNKLLQSKKSPSGELRLSEGERVALLDGQRVELTAQEFALLLALMQSPDAPISREQLLRTAWGYQSMGDTRTVDVHVQRLRKKLGCERIETVYKCGYRLITA